MRSADKTSLPIDDVIDEVVAKVRTDRRVVVQAPPGAGKSTRVPPALLDAAITDKQIVVLEPRRVAARAIASRIAAERGTRIGDEVGWQIRWARRGSSETRLWVMTEGILTRRIQSDPFLDDVGILILDEFHERSIHTDLALGFATELLDLRDDLHVIVMSATLDAERIAAHLDCQTVESDGRLYPVEVRWIDHDPDDLSRAVVRAIRDLLADPDDDEGDILVFLPGLREIDACRAATRSLDSELELHRLHGRLPEPEQDAALRPGSRRKVVFATNIAETSLTIEGVTSVIDSGLVRIAKMDARSGFDRLETTRISLASAEQRAGRAGRLAPGRAVRLWPRSSEFRMSEFDAPEIDRIDLTAALLDVMRWSGANPRDFPWFEPPAEARVASAVTVLEALDAVTAACEVTSLGERLSDMPLHPRIGRFLVEADSLGVGRLAADIGACLSESDWVTSVSNEASHADSDAVVRGSLLREVADGQTHRARSLGLRVNVGAARNALRVARDLERWSSGAPSTDKPEVSARKALLAAFSDRIAFHAEGRRYALTRGGSVALGYESLVREAEVIAATQVFGTARVDGVECAIARQASVVEIDWLPDDRFVDDVDVRFDPDLDRLVARRVRRFDDLVLSESAASLDEADVGDGDLAGALAAAVASDIVRAFGLQRDEERFLQRVDFLRNWMPELDLPDPRDVEFLSQALWGKTSFSELRREGFRTLYSKYLRGEQFEALDRHAPDRFELPSGRQWRIDYSDPEQPVLAARLQQFFGMKRTPTVADGRVEILLHLLAPNMRPAQITRDLESFWKNTYAEVRKELRARYPKHDWPEDPTE